MGEVRAVSRAAERAREAAALGFERLVVPARDAAATLELPVDSVPDVAGLLPLLGSE